MALVFVGVAWVAARGAGAGGQGAGPAASAGRGGSSPGGVADGDGAWLLEVRAVQGAALARWPVRLGQEIAMEYRHSTFHVPVRERFRVSPRGLALVAVEAPTPEIAWYYGEGGGLRWRLERLPAVPPLACTRLTPGRTAGWYRWAPSTAGPGARPTAAGQRGGGAALRVRAEGAGRGAADAAPSLRPHGFLRVRATPVGRRALVVGGRCVPLTALVGSNGEAVLTVRTNGRASSGRPRRARWR